MRQPPLDINYEVVWAYHQFDTLLFYRTQFNRSVRRMRREDQQIKAWLKLRPGYRSRKRKRRQLWKRWNVDVKTLKPTTPDQFGDFD